MVSQTDKTVLIVEDNDDYAKILEVFLEHEGFTTSTCRYPEDVEMTDDIGVFIVDYNLEDKQGHPVHGSDLIKRLKCYNRDMLVLGMTAAYGDKNILEDFYAADVHQVLPKESAKNIAKTVRKLTHHRDTNPEVTAIRLEKVMAQLA